MNWLYRTILFEFQKDGLLGDRYIDDDEMENVLNEHGEKGWELVSVTPVEEGLLAFMKRPRQQPGTRVSASPEKRSPQAAKATLASSVKGQQESVPGEERAAVPSGKSGQKKDGIGGIKIS